MTIITMRKVYKWVVVLVFLRFFFVVLSSIHQNRKGDDWSAAQTCLRHLLWDFGRGTECVDAAGGRRPSSRTSGFFRRLELG